MEDIYKNERFRDRGFPVYSSRQSGRGVLVVPHFHKAAELIWVTEGSVAVFIHGQKYVCGAGDTVFLPPYCVHSVTSETENAAIRGLVFELSLVSMDVFGLPPEKILSKNVITDFAFRGQDGICCRLNRLLWQAVEAYDRYGATYKLEMLSALYGIIALLVNYYFHSDLDYANYDRLQPVMDYINRNFQREIPLAELSGILNICDDHLIRLFKTATGKTPGKYIMELRLQEAMKLLIDTELSVTECASKSGFSGVNYMSRLFRTNLGMTPGQYRRKNGRIPANPEEFP